MFARQSVVIKHEKGLHARVIAMVVHKASEIQKKYDVELFITYKNRNKIPATSVMPLVLLKVKRNEEVIVEAYGERVESAVNELCNFLQGDFDIYDKNEINQIDNIINTNTITWEQVFESMANGIVVSDENDVITVFNPAAENILEINALEAIGKKVYHVIPNSRLHIVNKTKKAELMCKQLIGDSLILTNRTPILIDGQSKGAVASFEDISNFEKITGELKEVKELKERLQLILESVQDGICVINNEGVITYVNPAYLKILNEEEIDLINKNVKDISPMGARKKVLDTGRFITGAISYKKNGVTIVSNISPIVIDGEMSGAVSVVKNITEVQGLYEKLNKVSAKAEYLEEQLLRTRKPHRAFEKFKGKSGKVLDALAVATKAAQSNSTVLIRGESGTGKELIAEGIHFSSKRASGPFIRINCAAIPANLLESELFGHEKGAFTGAIKRKLGKFELAQNGTIFLDEIGELDKSVQAKILRIIQSRELQRLGGEETIKVNVRIIAATHRDLEQMVKDGEFREDLYYRLNVIPIIISPLRERKEDIALLVEHFIEKLKGEENIKGISKDAMDVLVSYKWPGNVRELENLIERIVALTDNEYIEVEDLPSYIKEEDTLKDEKEKILEAACLNAGTILDSIKENEEILPLAEYEKIIIEKALKKYGSYNAAGKALGITHKTVAAKAKLYGIEKVVLWLK